MITILKTERLILRPFDESDAESVYEYAKDGRVGPIAGWRAHTSVENSREIIRTVLAVPETYAVCLKEDNKAIGAVGLMVGGNSNIKMNDNEGEIGYWLGVPFWGQGLMPEAVRELIRHAFADLELKKLWCGYFDGNEKSRRCQEKCGFTYHHTEKDIYWALMDDIRTEHITCLTKEQWESGIVVRPLAEKEVQAALTAKDDNYACALADRIVSESRETDEWYCCFDDVARLLSHPKSLVRNRAFSILAANAQWDEENRFDKYIDEFLSHVTDEKPISARQCIKALALIGKDKPQYIPQILSALENADLSKYRDSMRPLIEKDISETKAKILS